MLMKGFVTGNSAGRSKIRYKQLFDDDTEVCNIYIKHLYLAVHILSIHR